MSARGWRPPDPPERLLERLLGVLAEEPTAVSIVDARAFLQDSRRPNDRRPGSVTFATTDEVVKSLRGKPEEATHVVLLVTLRTDAVRRLESPIVLPGASKP